MQLIKQWNWIATFIWCLFSVLCFDSHCCYFYVANGYFSYISNNDFWWKYNMLQLKIRKNTKL